MKLFAAFSFSAFLLSAPASAERLCAPEASIRPSVQYCDQNYNFVAPAQACVAKFQALLAKEQPRIQKLMAAAKTLNGQAQEKNFGNNGKALEASLVEVTYLSDYGKQVHTELEDYAYALVPPVYSSSEKGDPTNPSLKALFMTRDCYSESMNALTQLEAQLEPEIKDLDKTKIQMQGMAKISAAQDGALQTANGSLQNGVIPKAGQGSATAPTNGKTPYQGSSISGKITEPAPSH